MTGVRVQNSGEGVCCDWVMMEPGGSMWADAF